MQPGEGVQQIELTAPASHDLVVYATRGQIAPIALLVCCVVHRERSRRPDQGRAGRSGRAAAKAGSRTECLERVYNRARREAERWSIPAVASQQRRGFEWLISVQSPRRQPALERATGLKQSLTHLSPPQYVRPPATPHPRKLHISRGHFSSPPFFPLFLPFIPTCVRCPPWSIRCSSTLHCGTRICLPRPFFAPPSTSNAASTYDRADPLVRLSDEETPPWPPPTAKKCARAPSRVHWPRSGQAHRPRRRGVPTSR